MDRAALLARLVWLCTVLGPGELGRLVALAERLEKGPKMTLTDEDVAAIDAAAEVLRRVAVQQIASIARIHAQPNGRGVIELGYGYAIDCEPYATIESDVPAEEGKPSPGEALRRLVSR